MLSALGYGNMTFSGGHSIFRVGLRTKTSTWMMAYFGDGIKLPYEYSKSRTEVHAIINRVELF